MNLKDARNNAIKYCNENNCKYVHIIHDEVHGFNFVENEDKNTVFLVNRNGSLDAYYGTQYASDFHKELKRRRKNKRVDSKRKLSDMVNRDDEV